MSRFADIFYQLKKNPAQFVLRQVYRVFFVFPFVVLVSIFRCFEELFFDVQRGTQKVPYVVFITSVIYPTMSKAVSFGAVRSTYTPEERLTHTKNTIFSVRKHIPEAHIVLVEGGREDVSNELSSLVEQYIYVGKNRLARLACDGTSKSLGEAVMLFFAAQKVSVSAKYYFKLSGRYFLDDNFSLSSWGKRGFSFLVLRSDFFSTRLYGFSADMFCRWKYAIVQGMAYHLMDYPVENTMMRFVPRELLVSMSRLGVSGLGGSSHDIIQE